MGGLTHRTSLPELGHTSLDNLFKKIVSPPHQDRCIHCRVCIRYRKSPTKQISIGRSKKGDWKIK
jgi:NADH dehydrogenase/NADH:ubiquinone oxidoreductase subunit G